MESKLKVFYLQKIFNRFKKCFVLMVQYSGNLKSYHLKSGLFEGWISNSFFKWSGFCYGYSHNHLKTRPYEIQTFLSGFHLVFDKMAAICPDFRSNAKSGPFATQPLFDHSKSRQVRIPDPHCITNFFLILCQNSLNGMLNYLNWKMQKNKI